MERSRTRVALLIDGENSASISIASLLAEAGKLGEVIIRRVYGNWSSSSMHGWQEIARHYGLEQRHHGQTAPGKNATDIALAIDAMDILYSGAIDHFCLVASDSDYTPLVVRLRSAGCQVLGIGKPTTPLALKTACTAFVPTDQLVLPPALSLPASRPFTAPISTSPGSASPKAVALGAQEEIPVPLEPLALLWHAYEVAAQKEGNEWVRLSDLGIALKHANALFRSSVYGYKDLQAFIKAYPDHFEMRRQASKGKPILVRRKQASASVRPSSGMRKPAIPLASAPTKASAQHKAQPLQEDALAALLTQAYRNAAEKLHEEWVPIPNLGAALKQLDPHFKAKAYGYKNVPTLVQSYTDLFRTRKQKEGKTKHVEVCSVLHPLSG